MMQFPKRGQCILVITLTFWGNVGFARAVIPLSAPHLAQRVALADAVVLAKVDALKEDLILAFPILKIPGAGKVPFQIADLSVERIILAPGRLTQTQVGYIVARRPTGENPSRFRRLATVKLTAGEEGCFFLRQHPEEPFYVLQNAYDVIDKAKAKEFEKELTLVKRCAGLLKDPKAGLQAKEKADRLLTAAMLIFRYRTPQFIYTGKPKTVPIDAEESRRILTALSDGDWSEEPAKSQLAPLALFFRLDLTEEDGWHAPQTPANYPTAAQKWLRENGGHYRIRRYVAEK